jgi:hypothetical protein
VFSTSSSRYLPACLLALPYFPKWRIITHFLSSPVSHPLKNPPHLLPAKLVIKLRLVSLDILMFDPLSPKAESSRAIAGGVVRRGNGGRGAATVRRAIGEKTERGRKHRERGSNDNDDFERRRTTAHRSSSRSSTTTPTSWSRCRPILRNRKEREPQKLIRGPHSRLYAESFFTMCLSN